MAISNRFASIDDDTTITPLIMEDFVEGSVDSKGHPARRSTTGGWKSASFVIAVEAMERFVYYGLASNLITYLMGRLGLSTATAAENVYLVRDCNAFAPLGSFCCRFLSWALPDCYCCFFRLYLGICLCNCIMIVLFWALIILPHGLGLERPFSQGLGLLTLSALLTSHCEKSENVRLCSSPGLVFLFFFSLYLVTVGQGGHKPCIQAFGADQFDGQNPGESRGKSSFFNWCYFCSCVGILIALVALIYVQNNLNWVLGFGIPCGVMLAALLVFVFGSRTYRYSIRRDEKDPFMRIGRVIFKAVKNHQTTPSAMVVTEEACLYCQNSLQFKFLNRALFAPDGSMEDDNVCSVADVEETKSLLRLIPIWATSLVYAIVFAQTSTFFTKQGATMDRTIFPGYQIPAASLQSFIGITIILLIPIYDCIFIPIARALTMKPSGIMVLQRMGTGMVVSGFSMVAAALVEMNRLEIAKEYEMVDLPNPNGTVPMSVWWLVPQYVFCGAADVFTIIGLQEFFYDQVPKDLRSMGPSLFLSVMGLGSFLSSLLISVIDKATSGSNHQSWFANDLNGGHLDYFYWLLAGLSAVGFTLFVCFARSYIYSREIIH